MSVAIQVRRWDYTHAKTQRARFWGGSPKQTGLQTKELRNKKTADEATLPTANKAKDAAEGEQLSPEWSAKAGKVRTGSVDAQSGTNLTDQRAERPVDQSRRSTAEGLHWVLERLSNCTDAGRKNKHFPLQ